MFEEARSRVRFHRQQWESSFSGRTFYRFKFVGLEAKNNLIFAHKLNKLLMLFLDVINQFRLVQPYRSTISLW